MDDLRTLELRLGATLGLRPRRGSKRHLLRALHGLEQELGIGLEEVVARLAHDAELVGRLASALTVEETFFFRHPAHFDRLIEHLRTALPGPDAKPASVWSAGCSSGEEPYSMAMAIHRALGPSRLARVRIFASDIDATSLAKARRAVYGQWSFRGIDASLRKLYFEQIDDNAFQLIPVIREAVTFEHCSLEAALARRGPGSLDAIFFRNVAIYLTEDALSALYRGFARVLKPQGLFIIGPSDPPPSSGLFPSKGTQAVAAHAATAQLAATPVPCPPSASAGQATSQASRQAQPHGGATALAGRKPVATSAPSGRDLASAMAPANPETLRTARAQIQRGQLDEALATIDTALAERPQAALLGLRGCIALARSETEKGVIDLRAALYLDPSDHWLRFQYALGLHALHRHRVARAQLAELLRVTENASELAVLSDGETTLGGLRHAAAELLRRLS